MTATTTVVGPVSGVVMVPVGLDFRGTKLYTYNNVISDTNFYELDPNTGAILNKIITTITTPVGEGDFAFRAWL